MRTFPLVLGLLLAASITGNVILMRRLQSRPVETTAHVAQPVSAPAQPRPVTTSGDRLDLVLAEIGALRQEVAEIKSRGGPGAPNRPMAAPQDPPATATSNPKLAGIFAEQDKVKAFWKDMGKLAAARGSLKGDEYRSAVLEATADFLGLSGGVRTSFLQGGAALAGELEKAYKDYMDAVSHIKYDAKHPEAYQTAYQAAYQPYQATLNGVQEQMKSLVPQETPRQKQFATSLVPQWAGYFGMQHSYQTMQFDGGWGMAETPEE